MWRRLNPEGTPALSKNFTKLYDWCAQAYFTQPTSEATFLCFPRGAVPGRSCQWPAAAGRGWRPGVLSDLQQFLLWLKKSSSKNIALLHKNQEKPVHCDGCFWIPWILFFGEKTSSWRDGILWRPCCMYWTNSAGWCLVMIKCKSCSRLLRQPGLVLRVLH